MSVSKICLLQYIDYLQAVLCSVPYWDKGASINAGLDLSQLCFLVTNMYFPEKQKAAIVACVPDMWEWVFMMCVNIVQSNYLCGFLARMWSMGGKKVLLVSEVCVLLIK